jgi:hypothetical protein
MDVMAQFHASPRRLRGRPANPRVNNAHPVAALRSPDRPCRATDAVVSLDHSGGVTSHQRASAVRRVYRSGGGVCPPRAGNG